MVLFALSLYDYNIRAVEIQSVKTQNRLPQEQSNRGLKGIHDSKCRSAERNRFRSSFFK